MPPAEHEHAVGSAPGKLARPAGEALTSSVAEVSKAAPKPKAPPPKAPPNVVGAASTDIRVGQQGISSVTIPARRWSNPLEPKVSEPGGGETVAGARLERGEKAAATAAKGTGGSLSVAGAHAASQGTGSSLSVAGAHDATRAKAETGGESKDEVHLTSDAPKAPPPARLSIPTASATQAQRWQRADAPVAATSSTSSSSAVPPTVMLRPPSVVLAGRGV